MITTIHDFEVIWRIKLSDDFFYFMKTDIVEEKYLKIVGGVMVRVKAFVRMDFQNGRLG